VHHLLSLDLVHLVRQGLVLLLVLARQVVLLVLQDRLHQEEDLIKLNQRVHQVKVAVPQNQQNIQKLKEVKNIESVYLTVELELLLN